MIIPTLSELYDRLSQDPDVTAKGDLPTIGKSRQKISFRIILKPDGTLVGMDDIRAMDAPEGKKAAKLHSIPILVLGSSVTAQDSCDMRDRLLRYFATCCQEKPLSGSLKRGEKNA